MEIYPWVTGVLVVSLYKIQECGSLWGKKGITQITQGKTVKKQKILFCHLSGNTTAVNGKNRSSENEQISNKKSQTHTETRGDPLCNVGRQLQTHTEGMSWQWSDQRKIQVKATVSCSALCPELEWTKGTVYVSISLCQDYTCMCLKSWRWKSRNSLDLGCTDKKLWMSEAGENKQKCWENGTVSGFNTTREELERYKQTINTVCTTI